MLAVKLVDILKKRKENYEGGVGGDEQRTKGLGKQYSFIIIC